ncbi:hypothetical protein ACFSBZ_10920 [Amnibacterium flavum]|uniref:Uncharacterized protein n=1 Tax=Amnibacterium flavum TaxID=2173173 RepID=A0A2V1HRX0_9MICO|nr:hypothetical protein [Amnibacterium flavum]PVZ95343.1 hypothetical protein DDQ50_02145 [Amnibacterium flavum]
MVVDEPDDVLRRIVFGRGSTREQVREASAELQRRESERLAVLESPVPVDESAAVEADDRFAAWDPEQDSPPATAVPVRRRSPWPALLVTAVVAAAVGSAATAAAIAALMPEDAASADAPTAVDPGLPTSVYDPTTGRAIYSVPQTPEELGTDGLDRWFALPQGERDVLPSSVDRIDPASSRYVGQVGDLGGVWTARDVDGDYCLVVGVRVAGGTASSCANEDIFDRTGLYLGTEQYTVYWNASSVIMSVTQAQ